MLAVLFGDAGLLCGLCFHGWDGGLCAALGAARAVARVYLGGSGLCGRAEKVQLEVPFLVKKQPNLRLQPLVRLRDVRHDLVTRRGEVGGERRGRQRALHDPIVLTIVRMIADLSTMCHACVPERSTRLLLH